MPRRGTGLLDHFNITVAVGERKVFHRDKPKLDRYETDVLRGDRRRGWFGSKRVVAVGVGRNGTEARRHAWVIAHALANELERQRNMAAVRRARV